MNVPAAIEALDHIAIGNIGPDEALTLVIDALRHNGDHVAQRIYDALSSATWKLLTSRTYGTEMRHWHDLFRRSASLLSSKNYRIMSERVRALADLALVSARFGSVHPINEVFSRQHVIEILKALVSQSGEATKHDIMINTGLKDSNLSRILANMTAVGLVDRKRMGNEVIVSLTSFGRERLTRRLSNPPRKNVGGARSFSVPRYTAEVWAGSKDATAAPSPAAVPALAA